MVRCLKLCTSTSLPIIPTHNYIRRQEKFQEAFEVEGKGLERVECMCGKLLRMLC